jgi:hypothetical protein
MMTLKNTFALLMTLFLAQVSYSQAFHYVEYQGHDSIICNPERGFMHFTEAYSGGSYDNLDLNTLISYREQGITLVYRGFYLKDFTASDISGDYLNGMKKDFEIMRQAGVKAVVRFSYHENMSPPYGDAPIDIVLRHIEQVKPILQENSDVILVVQAGIIGAWGEWYYTNYYASSPGVIFPEHWALRRQIVNALLDAIPPTRMIELRTPGYKRILIENEQPVNAEQAYSDLPIARLAHHNDCFLSSPDDYGTYDDTLVDKIYLEAETKYTMIGGETCNPDPPYSDCPNSLHEMQRFHWTYLNWDYNTQLLNGWRTQGCFPEVERKMGYRYRMVEAEIQDSARPGGEFQVNLKMINEGWSNPVNPRKIELVIRNQESGKEYVYDINEDIRFRPLGEEMAFSIKAGIPQGMEQGTYKIFLNMPDPEISIRNQSRFSIRTANIGTWEDATGLNSLLSEFTVADNPALPAYNGTGFFYPRQAIIVESAKIQVDGQVNDWEKIGISCEAPGQPASIFKSYNSSDSLYYLIQGNSLQPTYQLFIDADNLETTGYYALQWKPNGADYLIENGSLYKYSGISGEWSWELVKAISASQNDSTIETGLAIADLNATPLGYQCSAAFVNDPENTVLASYLPLENNYFIQLQRLLEGPQGMRCTGYSDKVIAYWPGSSDAVYNVLERSTNDQEYEKVAILQNNTITFTDANLAENTAYQYRVYRTDGMAVSAATQPFSITTSDAVPFFVNMVTDGDAGDWNVIPPVATGYDQQLNALRLVNFGDSLYFSMEGPETITNYALFLNTDRNAETGLPSWQTPGFDYMIVNDSLYSAGEATWNFVKKILSVTSGHFLEGGLRMAEVNMVISGSAYVRAIVNTSELPQVEAYAEFIKMPQPGVPLYFDVKNSQTNPDTRIVIEWSKPGNVEGFIIERSVGDSVHFNMLIDLTNSETFYHDNTVHPDTAYFYRMYSYASLNRSAYTVIYGGYPGQIYGITESSFNAAEVKVYPNPFRKSAKVEVWMRYPASIHAEIFNLTGEKILELYNGKAERYTYFNIDEGLLKPGIYFIRIEGENINVSAKIITY